MAGSLRPGALTRRWTEAEVRAVLQLRRGGLRMVEIARRIGRSSGAIKQMLTTAEERLRTFAAGAASPAESERSKPKPAPSDDPRQRPKRRRCLGGCGKMFASAWAGNRICRACGLQASRRLDRRFEGGSTGAWK